MMNTLAELEKVGSMGSAEPNFFRFSSKSVLFSAKFLPNVIIFHIIYHFFLIFLKLFFTKFYQFFYQICDLRSFVAISNCCNTRAFLAPNLYAQNVWVDKKISFSNSVLAYIDKRVIPQSSRPTPLGLFRAYPVTILPS